MPITIRKDGGMSIEGPEAMKLYRMLTILRGLRWELKFPGGRLTGKAPSCQSIARREFGLKGRLPALIEQFQKLCDEQSAKVTRIQDGERTWRCRLCGLEFSESGTATLVVNGDSCECKTCRPEVDWGES